MTSPSFKSRPPGSTEDMRSLSWCVWVCTVLTKEKLELLRGIKISHVCITHSPLWSGFTCTPRRYAPLSASLYKWKNRSLEIGLDATKVTQWLSGSGRGQPRPRDPTPGNPPNRGRHTFSAKARQSPLQACGLCSLHHNQSTLLLWHESSCGLHRIGAGGMFTKELQFEFHVVFTCHKILFLCFFITF